MSIQFNISQDSGLKGPLRPDMYMIVIKKSVTAILNQCEEKLSVLPHELLVAAAPWPIFTVSEVSCRPFFKRTARHQWSRCTCRFALTTYSSELDSTWLLMQKNESLMRKS